MSEKNVLIDYKKLSIALSFAALNLIIGAIVAFLKLPIYLDSIGIIITTVLLGWQYGLICGLVTVGAGFFLINPYLPFYTATLLGIVFMTHFCRKLNLFASLWRSIIAGIFLAITAAILSAPVTVYLFEGSTLSGSDAITAYFISTGKNILESVVLSGISSEPVDKVIVCIISFVFFKSLPISFVKKHNLKSYKNGI